ncbi:MULTISPECIES: DUF418 domain-containing protein [unclassified Sphingopyxis]|uniref:DUF418 domain-containing protein n=1 Tax=unclassified Sphingopyxis TaxID=2614943 RepID=UPI0007373AD1|nr:MULTISPECIES: DUF418 domain-containing protein [unclassified Sphingopyxis]KTE37888.1 hypothetical protein ATE62_12190 [Sphingopyxis sp. HIX]KTE75683.1 hypothetical protein ATE72_20795 [Sphingopyxis sp. HXXIV]
MREDRDITGDRLITLDALRGFAVMGILAMNIVAFAMPEMAYVSPKAYGGETSSDIAAWAMGFLLFDGKMRGLFSILFGASMLLIIDRAEANGQSPRAVHYRRMAWLAVFGLCHFFFIWWGDILFLYASVGCIAFGFRKWEARRLIKWAIGLFTLGVVLTSLFFGAQLFIAAQADNPASPMAEAGRDVRDEYAKIDAEVTEELALYRGPYGPILDERLGSAANPVVGVLMTMLETLPLMMLGMALFRSGFLTGSWTAEAYRRIALRWLPPGVLLTLIVGWLQWRSGFDYIVAVNAFMAWAGPGRLMMTIAYAALLVLLIRRAASSPFIARVAAAGRAAFSNYLGTSIVMTTIFYGYGLGLFGDVGRWTLYLYCAAMWAVMLLWSKPWLDRYRYGPLEWLWRSLARGSLQPMKKVAPAQ